MNTTETTIRHPWCALALSFLAAGLGHIYCGRTGKGLILFCAWLLIPVAALVAAMLTPATTVLVMLILAPTLVMIVLYLYAALDALLTARRIGDSYLVRDYNSRRVYLLMATVGIVYPIVVITVIRLFVFEAFYVPSGSMSPSVLGGDRVLVNKLAYRRELPQRGEIVAFLAPGSTGQVYLKRVIALPGDTVEIRDDEVLINNQRLPRDRVPATSLSAIAGHICGDVFVESNAGRRYQVMLANGRQAARNSADSYGPRTVPEDSIFLLGDNRDGSLDSREFGFIHLGDVVGSVAYVYAPAGSWSRFGVL